MTRTVSSRAGRLLAATLLATLPAWGRAAGAEAEPDPTEEKVLIVPIEKPLTARAASRLVKQIAARLEDDALFTTVVFRIDAGGGETEASETLAAYIFDKLNPGSRRSVAWLPTVTEPLEGAIMIVMACQDVVLGGNAKLAAVGEDGSGPTFDDPFRKKLMKYAGKHRRPTLLAEAFVSTDHDDLFMVFFSKNEETRKYDKWDEGTLRKTFLSRSDLEGLPAEISVHELKDRRMPVVERGKSLRLDANLARRVAMTLDKPAGDRDTLLNNVAPDVDKTRAVTLGEGPLEALHPTGQTVIDFFNHPLVRFLLILGGCLGLLLEIKMLGTFAPSLIGLGCFLLLFVTSSFPVTGSEVGTATLLEILLFVVGIVLLGVELFLVPGVLVFALVGGALCVVSLVLTMVPSGTDPALTNQLTVKSAITLLVFGFGAGIGVFAALLTFLPKTWIGRKWALISHTSIDSVATADTAQEAQERTADLVGRKGVADTMLRPAGKALLEDGRIIDVVSEGGFIDPGTRIVITGAQGPHVTVAKLPDTGEKPGETESRIG